MAYKALSSGDVDGFVERGYVLLRDAFPRDAADAVRAMIWKKLEPLGPREGDPATWKKPAVRLEKCFGGGPFRKVWTPRVEAAFDDLMGAGRWARHAAGLAYRPKRGLIPWVEPWPRFGYWTVTFPGFHAPPWRPERDWHVDGVHFHHRLAGPEQGLLPIFIFSDIAPGDGGTAVSAGSHRRTARLLADAEPKGLSPAELNRHVESAEVPPESVVEMTGRAGDVALLHPFLWHARAINTGPRVRFICNPCFALREPMDLNRADPADYSPVERAIVAGLGR